MAQIKLVDEEKKEAEAEGERGDGGGEVEEEKIYYQKDNFFDNISCEALEREGGGQGGGGRWVGGFMCWHGYRG